MTAEVVRATVAEGTLDVAEHAALVEHAGAGAVVTFAGVVRDHDGGKSVTGLTYSAHPTAAAVVAEVWAATKLPAPPIRTARTYAVVADGTAAKARTTNRCSPSTPRSAASPRATAGTASSLTAPR